MGEKKAKQYRAVRLRLRPNKAAKQRIDANIDASRFAWNYFLGEDLKVWLPYLKGKKIPWCSASLKKPKFQSYYDLCHQFHKFRKETNWLQETAAGPARLILDRLTKALKDKSKGIPNFKSRYAKKQSFDMNYCMTKVNGDQIRIPGASGQPKIWLRMHGSNNHADKTFKKAIIHREWGKYYITLVYEFDEVKENNGQKWSIKRNIDNFTTFNGQYAAIVGHPNVEHLEKKRRRLQRKLARQQERSNRYSRTKRRIRRTSARISNTFKNFYHHWSKVLANSQVFIDKLNIKSMSESAISEFNRLIRQARWAQFQWMLSYKAFKLHEINPAFISQTCSGCGKIGKRDGKRFSCEGCGCEQHADSNAAINILARGMRSLDVEKTGLPAGASM